MFSRDATPASGVFSLSLFVFAVTAGIFVVVASLLTYAVIKFRARPGDETSEPIQIFGSNQIEVSWTIIPVLIVVVLFLTTARMIFAVQDAPQPKAAIKVNTIGHQALVILSPSESLPLPVSRSCAVELVKTMAL